MLGLCKQKFEVFLQRLLVSVERGVRGICRKTAMLSGGLLQGTESVQTFEIFCLFLLVLRCCACCQFNYIFSCPIMAVSEAQADMASVSNPSSGMFEIAEASGVRTGTKIIIHLKEDCKEFANEDRVKGERRREMLLPTEGMHGVCWFPMSGR